MPVPVPALVPAPAPQGAADATTALPVEPAPAPLTPSPLPPPPETSAPSATTSSAPIATSSGAPTSTTPAVASADASAAPADIRIVTATVCETLATVGAWQCAPLGEDSRPGQYSYYTRIASPRDVRVHHRWYQDDQLRQDVVRSVGANASAGYRTFSRQVVTPGAWRVELRADDGALLDEARFVVR